MAQDYHMMANAIRALSMDAVEAANSGHPGMPMGMADVATVLFSEHLKFNANDPHWPNRDRFVLSAGHGSMLLYSLLYLTGYKQVSLEEIKQFRQLHSKTPGHPEYGHTEGVETTTGPLGQGLANAVGFALAERLLNARFGDNLVDHHTYTIVGDGCLMEGISQEAISFAGHMQLSKLIVLFDDNGISIDGPTSLATSEDHLKRFEACGFDVQAVDGHDAQAISNAIAKAKQSNTPSFIACKTQIAYGSPNKVGSAASHGAPLGAEEIALTKKQLGWEHGPFEIPQDVLDAWRAVGARGAEAQSAWNKYLQSSDKQAQFNQLHANTLSTDLAQMVGAYKKTLIEEQPGWATRKASGNVLEVLTEQLPELLGGSADLTGSNNTRTKAMQPVTPQDFSGNYIHYGIREHAMAAMMNGIALHKGFIPYSGTFLTFSDYCRPSIRLSALMEQRVIYVMTHDSIGLGEDGPTHQPVEHVAALRAMPNVLTIRPADAVETLEAWQVALSRTNAPSVLALTRQGVPMLRKQYQEENQLAKGAYILAEAEGNIDVTIFATGSEVHLATEARDVLQAQGIGVRVVSVPCMELFEEQSSEYQQSILCNDSIKIAVEAALSFGWHRYIGAHGIFIGMEGFGASAPAGELYEYFGITKERIVSSVLDRLKQKKAS